jgi:hypothetical protein
LKEGLSDNDGNFSIQVPERDSYYIDFYDPNYDYRNGNGFPRHHIQVSSEEIKQSLKVELEKFVLEETDEATE